MSKTIPSVQKFMTTTPVAVEPSMTLGQALKRMQEGNFRHLPVVEDNKLLGIVSLSDVRLVTSLAAANAAHAKIEDVMTLKPFQCGPDAALDSVVDEMVAHKWGSAVVVQNGKVVGIFTATDAMRALVDLARTRLK